jgi:hypothetical protein
MLCSRPFRKAGSHLEHGCGQCMPCRVNKRRTWTGRMLLEGQHQYSLGKHSAMLTLTYDNENIPENGSLSVKDYKLFLYRFRKNIGKIRYYLAAEYGEHTQRPHYHILLFGLDHELTNGSIEKAKINWPNYYSDFQKKIYQCWADRGNIHVAPFNSRTAMYCTSHIAKGWTKSNDFTKSKLGERIPEFQRMSTKPGLGYEAARIFAEWYLTKEGARFLTETGDIGHTFRYEGKQFEFGKYLKESIRDLIGWSKPTPVEARKQYAMQVHGDCLAVGHDNYYAEKMKKRRKHENISKQFSNQQTLRRSL